MYDEKYFIRRLVKPLIEFFKKTSISAEELTLFRIFFGFFTFLSILFGSYLQSLVVVFLYQFILLLDYIDGSIARYRNNFKISWVYVDLIGHIVLSFLFIISITFSYYFKTSSNLFLFFGCLTGILFLFNNIFSKKSHLDKWKEIHKNPKRNKEEKFSNLKVFVKIEKPFGLFFILIMLNLCAFIIIFYFILYFINTTYKFYSEFKSLKNEKYR